MEKTAWHCLTSCALSAQDRTILESQRWRANRLTPSQSDFRWGTGECVYMPTYAARSFPVHAQMAAVSEGRCISDVGVQTGADASSCCPHSTALRPHVLCEKAFFGLPEEDRLAAGTVPRLPHTVSLLKVQSSTHITTKTTYFMVLLSSYPPGNIMWGWGRVLFNSVLLSTCTSLRSSTSR